MIRKADALHSLRPKSKFAVRGDVIEWFDTEQTQPSQSEIDAEVIRLQADYDAKEYQRQRKAEYPSIEELVVALYDTDDKADIETKRAAVKAKYPKPA
jgi:hypothetical protein